MTICPIAIAVGCKKCPIFKICPVKSLLGDVPKAADFKPIVSVNRKPVKKAVPKTVAQPTSKPTSKTAVKKVAARKKVS